MTEKSTLIDSDIFISILRQERPTFINAKKYLQVHGKFKIRNGEKINQASWLLLLSLFFTLKTVIIST